jgi:hypothetical protein
VGNEIDLEEARPGVVPLSEGPDRDLVFGSLMVNARIGMLNT